MTFLTTLKTSNFFLVRFLIVCILRLKFLKNFIRFILFIFEFFKRSFPIRFLFFGNL